MIRSWISTVNAPVGTKEKCILRILRHTEVRTGMEKYHKRNLGGSMTLRLHSFANGWRPRQSAQILDLEFPFSILVMYVLCSGVAVRYRRKIGGKRLAEIPSDASGDVVAQHMQPSAQARRGATYQPEDNYELSPPRVGTAEKRVINLLFGQRRYSVLGACGFRHPSGPA